MQEGFASLLLTIYCACAFAEELCRAAAAKQRAQGTSGGDRVTSDTCILLRCELDWEEPHFNYDHNSVSEGMRICGLA